MFVPLASVMNAIDGAHPVLASITPWLETLLHFCCDKKTTFVRPSIPCPYVHYTGSAESDANEMIARQRLYMYKTENGVDVNACTIIILFCSKDKMIHSLESELRSAPKQDYVDK